MTGPYPGSDDPNDPRTRAFLEEQNAATDAAVADQEELRETIYREIKARNQETDLGVPARRGDWLYYPRTVEGMPRQVHCRRPAHVDDGSIGSIGPAGPIGPEEILLDENEVAQGHGNFGLGAFEISPNGDALAYSVDLVGDERYTLHVRDLATGLTVSDGVSGIFHGLAWSSDASTLFYVRVDDAWRPCQVWRHVVGTPAAEDALVFAEDDERFGVRVALSRSERFVVITSQSLTTSEIRLLDAAKPDAPARVVAPRRPGVRYRVEHQADASGRDRLLVLHDDGAPNFELATAAPDDPGRWTALLPHRDDTMLLSVHAFETFVAVAFRRDGLTGLRILRADGDDREIAFDEPLRAVAPGDNPDHRSRRFRLTYESLATPASVYDYDVDSGTLTLLKRRAVLALTPAAEYDPGDFEQHWEWAEAPDGEKVPISIVVKRGTPRDGTAPFLLMGYGGYGVSFDPMFAIPRLSLLDRGFGFAVAHVRGGGELGRRWHEAGKLMNKKNSFSDFLACAHHLAATGWTSPDRLIARGASAGGLLVAAALNLDPQAFAGAVVQVPFVDVLTTMSDPKRPLTITEREEWGDPLHDPQAREYLASYSPPENIRPMRYPPVIALAALNDTRVRVTEAAKWIASLQAHAHGGPFLLRTDMSTGHGGPSGRYDAWRQEAFVAAWALATVGSRDAADPR